MKVVLKEMKRLLKSFKTEINPTEEQKQIINKTIGVCRYIYNFFIAYNKEIYELEKRFVTGMTFSKWLNNEYISNNPDKLWIKEVYSKAVKQSIMNAERAFKKFFNRQANFPRFKKKKDSNVKMYFVKNDVKMKIDCERHRIKIPTLGWVRIKEKGYLPVNRVIKSGYISKKADRYYVSVLVDIPNEEGIYFTSTDGIGIDLGIKEFAVISNGKIKSNINRKQSVRKLKKKLRREQRKLSRKYESVRRIKNKIEGEATRQNIYKQVIVIQRLHQRLDNIRTDNINKIVNEVVKTKPSHITIEDMNVRGMMKNRHLSKAVVEQKFYEFRTKLTNKCRQQGIELRLANRFYPSSKLCHNCGSIKSDLKLSDRVYTCECGYTEDRDVNASLNLRDAIDYKLA